MPFMFNPCQPCCTAAGGGGGRTACGCSGIPDTLHVTFSSISGCDCISGQTLTLTYNITTQRWEGFINVGNCEGGFVSYHLTGLFSCHSPFASPTDFLLTLCCDGPLGSFNCSGPGNVENSGATSGACSPFVITFDFSGSAFSGIFCCQGTYSFTATVTT